MSYSNQIPFVIKICGITREQDADCAIQAGANALGFNFYTKSPRYLTLEKARAIAARVPETVLRVGIFVNATAEELRAATERVPLDVVQLHGHIDRLDSAIPAWRAVPYTAVEPVSTRFNAYVLDHPTSNYGGSGQSFDWHFAANACMPVILAGGLDASNVGRAVEIARPWGVDACSRLESKPGEKDPERVRAFVEAASTALRTMQEITL